MTIAVADFTAAFPEFQNTTTYPAATINFWIGQAYAQLNACRFGAQLDLAAMLYVAHNVVLSARAAQAAGPSGAGVAGSSGVQSSKSVGGVSVSYDNNLTASAGAGAYNATSYGQRLWQMIRAFGTGPVYAPSARAPAPSGTSPFSYWTQS